MNVDLEAGMALVLSAVAIMGTITTVIGFALKLKWDTTYMNKEILQLQNDLNAMGQKVDDQHDHWTQKLDKTLEAINAKMVEHKLFNSDEMRSLSMKVDSIDKAVITLTLNMTYVTDTVKELKEKWNRSTAIV